MWMDNTINEMAGASPRLFVLWGVQNSENLFWKTYVRNFVENHIMV